MSPNTFGSEMHRRDFLKRFALAGAAWAGGEVLAAEPTTRPAEQPLFTFGAVADCQYCNLPGGGRRYSLSIKKLTACVEHFNRVKPKFVIHLGDFIDRDFASFDAIGAVAKKLDAPLHFALGNHDFSVADDKKLIIPKRLGMTARYYDFLVAGWRFIVLDTNDVSLYAYPKADIRTKLAAQYRKDHPNDRLAPYAGAVGPKQLAWLEARLAAADKAGEKVVVFAHHPIFPSATPADRGRCCWNPDEVRKVLTAHACFKAYINGHHHPGGYAAENNIGYLTLKGMVDTEQTAYALVHVYPDRQEVIGTGRQGNLTMPVPK